MQSLTRQISRTTPLDAAPLLDRYRQVRAMTERLFSTLEPEDFNLQSMPDASPAKWHAAHTSWFFERFVLRSSLPGYTVYDERWEYLFNSYYNAIGERHCRARRGGLSRPTIEEIRRYRHHIDESMQRLFGSADISPATHALIELGLNHEQQHQELLVTDILHAFWSNPLLPAVYPLDTAPAPTPDQGPLGFVPAECGVRRIGRDPRRAGFAFDNESPRHRAFLEPYELADRLVTNAEFREFIEDGGYERSELWLDEGWRLVRSERWSSPLYWRRADEARSEWREFTPRGDHPLRPHAPVCCVGFFEADAYARWRGCRLPTEAEWESACASQPVDGNLLESGRLRACALGESSDAEGPIRQAFGDCWEWTRSDYCPYPGFAPPQGAVGEYNGKFMSGQYVLRGGSFATPRSHLRATYRNFWPAHTRWQFAGIRLARGGAEETP